LVTKSKVIRLFVCLFVSLQQLAYCITAFGLSLIVFEIIFFLNYSTTGNIIAAKKHYYIRNIYPKLEQSKLGAKFTSLLLET